MIIYRSKDWYVIHTCLVFDQNRGVRPGVGQTKPSLFCAPCLICSKVAAWLRRNGTIESPNPQRNLQLSLIQSIHRHSHEEADFLFLSGRILDLIWSKFLLFSVHEPKTKSISKSRGAMLVATRNNTTFRISSKMFIGMKISQARKPKVQQQITLEIIHASVCHARTWKQWEY